MSIESTMTVLKSNAIDMLKCKNIEVFDDDCNDRLALLLYENRESIFENYSVEDDDYKPDVWKKNMKTGWEY